MTLAEVAAWHEAKANRDAMAARGAGAGEEMYRRYEAEHRAMALACRQAAAAIEQAARDIGRLTAAAGLQ